jgi:metallophosphoesterase (TIGR00282 family)
VPDGTPVAVVNLEGRVFMNNLDCPFRAADRLLEGLRDRAKVILVDFHAEASSEKIAFGHYLAGRVSAVVGTHTHVQTADERILGGGTAFITDVGMTGSLDSVIGIQKEIAVEKFLKQVPMRFEVAKKHPVLCAVLLDVDADNGCARSIERIFQEVS